MEDQPFRQILSTRGVQISGGSLLRFEAAPFTEIPQTDWVFFYSRKAVAFFFRRVRELGVELDRHLKWAAIGPSTAVSIESWGMAVDFIGDGEPAATARHFLAIAEGRRVLFPRAAHSRESIQQLLRGKIEVLDLVVYHNLIDAAAPRPEADVLVFTSPLNAQAYFAQRTPAPGAIIIAIGQTTAAALKNLGVREVIIAAEPSERGLAQAVLAAVGLE